MSRKWEGRKWAREVIPLLLWCGFTEMEQGVDRVVTLLMGEYCFFSERMHHDTYERIMGMGKGKGQRPGAQGKRQGHRAKFDDDGRP